MGSEPDRQHSAETEKSVLGEESVGPSESGSTPLEDRSETWWRLSLTNLNFLGYPSTYFVWGLY